MTEKVRWNSSGHGTNKQEIVSLIYIGAGNKTVFRTSKVSNRGNSVLGDCMTRDERRQMLESFGRSPALLATVLRQLPKKMWLYQPTPQHWSIHEIILHLADSEASSYVLCRHLIAEPDKTVAKFDAARWAGMLGYFHQSTREAIEIIRRLRRMTYGLLGTLPEPVWLHTLEHPTEGKISLETWMDRQERHIPHHIEQMKQNYETWFRSHPPRKPAARSSRPGTQSRVMSSLSAERC